MRTAIAHDHFLYFGGAERVLLVLLKLFPGADVYLAFATKKNIEQLKLLTTGKVFTSPLNALPFAHALAEWFKPLVFFYWESLDLSKYDVVISSSHSFSSKSVITQPHTLHISYIYTPPRYLYTEFNETQIINKLPLKILLSPFITWLRMADYLGAQRPDVLITSSKIVQKRIRKYYRRDSTVFYPPVTIPDKLNATQKKEYFLIISRLVKQKGVDLAIRACNKLKVPLVIVGEGREEKHLRSISGPTISFKGFIPDENVANVYSKTKALIYCSREEDFGLTPVEAMSHGVPVIAFRSGGVEETVVDGVTGILFRSWSPESLAHALRQFPNQRFSVDRIRKQSAKFSAERFSNELFSLLEKYNLH